VGEEFDGRVVVIFRSVFDADALHNRELSAGFEAERFNPAARSERVVWSPTGKNPTLLAPYPPT
jgi:hypothetical protein